MTVKIYFLGTGTSQGVPMIGCSCQVCTSQDPRNTRFRTHIHVEVGDLNIQVDAAPEFRIQALRHSIPKVDCIFLTHGHADHILGMDDMRRYCDMRNGTAIPIYTTKEGEERMRGIFGYAIRDKSVTRGYPAFSLERMPEDLDLGEVYVCSTIQEHGNFETLGLVFEEKRTGAQIAYYTDCSSVSEEAEVLANGVDIAILDGLRYHSHPSHMTIDEAIKAAGRIGAKQTYLVHMTHDIDHASAEKALPDGVRFAYDDLVLEI